MPTGGINVIASEYLKDNTIFKLDQPLYRKLANASDELRKTIMEGVETKPLRFFCPNGAQEKVILSIIEACKSTKVPTIVVTFANGVGKSYVAAQIIANIIYGPQNGWFDYEIFRDFPFPKLIWYCAEPDTIKDKFIPEFEKLINPIKLDITKDYESTKDYKTFTSLYTFQNGWRLSCKSYGQEPDKFESVEAGLIVNDEPPPGAIRRAQKSRRRMGCITLNIMTPLYCEPEIFDEIVKAREGVGKGSKQRLFHLQADVYEACKRRGIRGHLDPDIIDDMVAEYDESEREARAFGKAMYFSGRIYPNFGREKHFVDPKTYPIPKNSIIKQIVDPHDGRPCACIYAAITPEGRIIIFDETPLDKSRQFWEMKIGFTIEQEIKSWVGLEDRYESTIRTCTTVSRVMDRHFGWQARGKSNFAELFYDEGKLQGREFNFQKSYEATTYQGGEIHYGHVQVNKALLSLADGKPGLVVWNTCYHVWEGLTHYIRKHETTKGAEDKPAQSGKIVEKYKDMADCVRILVCDTELPRIPADEKTRYERELEKVMSRETPIDEKGFELDQSDDEYLSDFFEGEL